MRQAESLRLQASAAEAQSHAFSVIGSIVCAIVHGFNSNAQRGIDDEIRRNNEKLERELDIVNTSSIQPLEPLVPIPIPVKIVKKKSRM